MRVVTSNRLLTGCTAYALAGLDVAIARITDDGAESVRAVAWTLTEAGASVTASDVEDAKARPPRDAVVAANGPDGIASGSASGP